MKKQYKHVLFDLDHTLWDFNANCTEALQELFIKHELNSLLKCNFEDFRKQYLKINAQMWAQYNRNQISKNDMRRMRFNLVMQHFGTHNDALSIRLDYEYIDICPKKGKLIEGTIEILDYIKPNYSLHILTNGFQETQETKLKYSKLDHYFSEMTTSESCGVTKPSPMFFKHHLKKIDASPSECIMIGDNINTDIRGANAFKIDSVLFDQEKSKDVLKGKQTYLITELSQLKGIL